MSKNAHSAFSFAEALYVFQYESCLVFGLGTRMFHLKSRCSKCPETHPTASYPSLEQGDEPKSANCGTKHEDSNRNCLKQVPIMAIRIRASTRMKGSFLIPHRHHQRSYVTTATTYYTHPELSTELGNYEARVLIPQCSGKGSLLAKVGSPTQLSLSRLAPFPAERRRSNELRCLPRDGRRHRPPSKWHRPSSRPENTTFRQLSR